MCDEQNDNERFPISYPVVSAGYVFSYHRFGIHFTNTGRESVGIAKRYSYFHVVPSD